MMKITPRPTWQWSGTKPQGAVSLSRPAPTRSILPEVKQALLPRSLDVSFSLSYRR